MKKIIFYFILLCITLNGCKSGTGIVPGQILTDVLDASSNHFIIINKTNNQIDSIIFNKGQEVINSKSNHNITLVKNYGISYERTGHFDVKDVNVFMKDYGNQSLIIIFDSASKKLLNHYWQLKDKDNNLVEVFVRAIFLQKSADDVNSQVILGIEISDKANFNTSN